ncbi:MAG: adenylyltransferase/cytidyltransferase family protein [Pseudomonadales bacterium]|nr:adenylyltransferase/cytidyltransferase family protein [Pseudomonadales bacterium]
MAKTVITYGTFDLFHVGHLRLLQKLKAIGDTLIVAVSTDEFNAQKGKKAIIPFEQRKEVVENIKCVDLVVAEHDWDQKIADIMNLEVDIFAIGDDWKGEFDFLEEYCQVIYMQRTAGISSTQLKNTLKSLSVSKSEIVKAFDILEQLKKDFE